MVLDYSFSPDTEIFLLSVLLGGALGVVYDFIRVFNALFPHGKIITFIEDFMYMLLSGFALFTFSVSLSGEIRYFTVAGMFMGWIIEHFTVGNGIVFVFRKIGDFLKMKIYSPITAFITKSACKIIGKFVKIKPKSKNKQKVVPKPLKVQ